MKNQKEFYLTEEVFRGLFRKIIERNCSEIAKEELLLRVKNAGAVAFLKKYNEGIEKCFHGFFNECEVIICTTWSDSIGKVKEHDIGWVLLISPNSKEPFFSFEIRRSKNYCDKVIAWLDCMIEIAEKWPVMPQSDIKLELVRASKMHMRRFKPPKYLETYPFRKPFHFWIVEMDLSEKNSKFLIGAFKRFYTYRSKDDENRIESGLPPRQFRRVIRHDQKNGNNTDDVVYNDGPHSQ